MKVLPRAQLATFKKQYIDDIEENKDTLGEYRESTKNMQAALIEWNIVGNAEYCMSPTVEVSTFSQTSMISGNCKFIPFDKKSWNFRGGYDCVHFEANNLSWPNRMQSIEIREREAKEVKKAVCVVWCVCVCVCVLCL